VLLKQPIEFDCCLLFVDFPNKKAHHFGEFLIQFDSKNSVSLGWPLLLELIDDAILCPPLVSAAEETN
jgi:hypothetical protein